jgi:acyl carrier protein
MLIGGNTSRVLAKPSPRVGVVDGEGTTLRSARRSDGRMQSRGGAIEFVFGSTHAAPPGPRLDRNRVDAAAGKQGRLARMEALEQEIKELIIDVLMLEDVTSADIESQAALFVDGLGLDSIDALELAMALEEQYGVKIGDDPEQNQRIFASVRDLAAFVTENRV